MIEVLLKIDAIIIIALIVPWILTAACENRKIFIVMSIILFFFIAIIYLLSILSYGV